MSDASDDMDANDRERQRLVDLVAGLGAGEPSRIVHDRWTVAAKLAHLAFWDRVALGHLERWAAGQEYVHEPPGWYDDVLNDAVLVESLTLVGGTAVQLVLAAAEAIDARLRGLEARRAERLLVDHDAAWLLRRHNHRAEHLDEIEGRAPALTSGLLFGGC